MVILNLHFTDIYSKKRFSLNYILCILTKDKTRLIRERFELNILFISFPTQAISYFENTDSLMMNDTTSYQATGLLQTIAENNKKQSQLNYISNAESKAQSGKFIELNTGIRSTLKFFKEEFEYKKGMELVSTIADWKKIAVNRVVTNPDSLQASLILIIATSTLLKELVSRTENWLYHIPKYHNSQCMQQHRHDSLAMEGLPFLVPMNSYKNKAYSQKLIQLKNELDPLSEAIKGTPDYIQQIEIQVNLLKTNMESVFAETETLQKFILGHVGKRILKSFNKTASRQKTFPEIITNASVLAGILVVFYYANHMFLTLLMMVSAFGFVLFMHLLIWSSRKANILDRLKWC